MDSTLPAVDRDQLLLLLDDDSEPEAVRKLAAELFVLYSRDAQRAMDRLDGIRRRGDGPALSDLVHSLGGGAANLGLARFSQFCRDIESAIKTSRFSDYAVADAVIRAAVSDSCEEFKAAYGL